LTVLNDVSRCFCDIIYSLSANIIGLKIYLALYKCHDNTNLKNIGIR